MPNHETSTYSIEYLCVWGYSRGTSSAPSWQPLAPDSMCAICRRISVYTKARSNIGRWVRILFTALLLRRKYLLWRCALACERLRCEPWRPWGWGETTRGLTQVRKIQVPRW